MRIYQNFGEAMSEIARDLKEMGTLVKPHTMQNKQVGGDPNFETFELQNYGYRVINPNPDELKVVQPWATNELNDRIAGGMGLPYGEAWKLRPELWNQFMNARGQQDYLYAERFARNHKLARIIARILDDPDSRQLVLTMWDDNDITQIGGAKRVPCSIDWQFLVREGAVHITYTMRSCDFATHIQSDLWFATNLMRFVADQTSYAYGDITHFVGSLHVYRKDVKDVF